MSLQRILSLFKNAGKAQPAEPTPSFIKMRNPYTFGVPVSSEGEFFGREQELQLIFDTLGNVPTGQKQDIVVLGTRRIGKSSLLNRLVSLLSSPDSLFMPVYVDLQSVFPRDNRVLLVRIASSIRARYTEHGYELPVMETLVDASITPELEFLTFSEDMERLNIAIRDKSLPRLVLMFDEVEVLVDFGGIAVLEWLRSLVQSLNYVVFIVAGSDRLYSLTQDYGSPFYNIFKTVELFPLEREAARALITEPAATIGLEIHKPEVNKILDYSGGNPYFVQGIAHYLVETLNEKQRRQVTNEDIDQVIIKSIAYLSAQFGYYWTIISQVQRAILFALARLGSPQRVGALIAKIPTVPQWLPSSHEQMETFDNLVQQQILKPTRKDTYWFVVPLFVEWILSNVDDQLIKEMVSGLQEGRTLDTSGLRRFLNLVLSDEDLTRLVFGEYDAIVSKSTFTFTASKGEMINRLIEGAERQGAIPRLMNQMREQYPQQFAAFAELIPFPTVEPVMAEARAATAYNRRHLYELIIKHFNRDELLNIAFSLQLNPDSIDFSSSSAVVRELLLLTERLGLQQQLLALLKSERPFVDWVADF